MSMENPFSNTRKAVEKIAEEFSDREALREKKPKGKPDSWHYELALRQLRNIKIGDPKRYPDIVEIKAREKDLSDSLGPLEPAFREVANGVIMTVSEKIDGKIKEMPNADLADPAVKQEIAATLETLLEEAEGAMRNDPKIVAAFEHEEKKLDEAMDFFKFLVRKTLWETA